MQYQRWTELNQPCNAVLYFISPDQSKMKVEDFIKEVDIAINTVVTKLLALQEVMPAQQEDIQKLLDLMLHLPEVNHESWGNPLPSELINCFSLLIHMRHICYGKRELTADTGVLAFLPQ